VTVVQDNGDYELNLDGRKLKTPAGSVFRIRNRELALAIQTEWLSQKELIRLDQMHLTTLTNTCIDNPMALSRESLATSILEYLMTDTLCFRSEEPPELVELENRLWDPIVEWFMNQFDVQMSVTADLFSAPVPDTTRAVLMVTYQNLIAVCVIINRLFRMNRKTFCPGHSKLWSLSVS
jgi:ATP synthase F1 complex assembly factor 2